MKKLLLAAIVAVCSSAALAAGPDLKVAVDLTYEPFTYKTPDGKAAGFDVDIARAICEEIKRNCVFVEQPWDSMIPGLLAKKYDVIISSMSITPERLRQVDFSDRYYFTPSRIALKKDIPFDGLASLKGKKLGVLKSSTQEKYATAELVPLGAQLVSYDAQDQVYLDIKAGRLDGTVADVVEVGASFLNKPGGENYHFVGEELYTPKYFGVGVGVAMRKGQDSLKNAINAAIKTLRANGTYQTLNDKYFTFDAYGK